MHEFTTERTSLNRTRGSTRYLPCSPGEPFLYAHHSKSWLFIEDGQGSGDWVPRPKRLRLTKGANAIRQGDFSQFRAKLEREGYIVLMDDTEVIFTEGGELVEDEGYLLTIECEHPRNRTRGVVYVDPWDRPSILGDGQDAKVDWHTYRDRDGFVAWCRSLLTSGRVRPATAGVIREAINLQQVRVNRYNRKPPNEVNAAAHKREAARLEAMRASLEALLQATDAPKTKRRAKGRAKRASESVTA